MGNSEARRVRRYWRRRTNFVIPAADGTDEIQDVLHVREDLSEILIAPEQTAASDQYIKSKADYLVRLKRVIGSNYIRLKARIPDGIVNLDFRDQQQRPLFQTIDAEGQNICRFMHCSIESQATQGWETDFIDCNVADLRLPSNGTTKVTIEDSRIGKLSIHQAFAGRLNIKNSRILELSFSRKSELTGIDLEEVRFSTFNQEASDPDIVRRPLVNRQCLHNFRVWTESIGDKKAAHFARSVEMEAERNAEKGLFWFLLVLHAWFSNYGASPLKPLIWMFGFYVAAVVFFFCADGGTVGVPEDWLTGWQLILTDEYTFARLNRSIAAPLQNIVNPFGLFSSRKLVEANHWWMSGILFVQGLFSLAMIFLSISAIRRRFHFG